MLTVSPLQGSLLGTGKGEGVEVLQQDVFHNAQGEGLYVHKKIHLNSRLPRHTTVSNNAQLYPHRAVRLRWVRVLLPSDVLVFEERTWNQFPYTRTEYSSNYLGEKVSWPHRCALHNVWSGRPSLHRLMTRHIPERRHPHTRLR